MVRTEPRVFLAVNETANGTHLPLKKLGQFFQARRHRASSRQFPHVHRRRPTKQPQRCRWLCRGSICRRSYDGWRCIANSSVCTLICVPPVQLESSNFAQKNRYPPEHIFFSVGGGWQQPAPQSRDGVLLLSGESIFLSFPSKVHEGELLGAWIPNLKRNICLSRAFQVNLQMLHLFWGR